MWNLTLRRPVLSIFPAHRAPLSWSCWAQLRGGCGSAAAVAHVLLHVEADGKCQTSVHNTNCLRSQSQEVTELGLKIHSFGLLTLKSKSHQFSLAWKAMEILLRGKCQFLLKDGCLLFRQKWSKAPALCPKLPTGKKLGISYVLSEVEIYHLAGKIWCLLLKGALGELASPPPRHPLN